MLTVDPRRVRILIVGGGAAAAGEAELVARAGGSVRVVTVRVGPELQALCARIPGVVVETRDYAPDDVAWATLVFAASDDAALNARVADHALAAGRLVSAPDGAGSTFHSAIAARAGEIVVAVSTGDVEPLARRIRDQLGDRIGRPYAEALQGLVSLRTELLARGLEERWRDALEALLDEDACAAIER